MFTLFRSLAIASAITLTGCASIIHGPNQDVQIGSTPAAAAVLIDGEQVGVTPYAATLTRKEEHTVELRLRGYQPYEITLEKRPSNWVFGNILIGGLIGFGIDAATGSIYKLTPLQIDAEMVRRGRASAGVDTQNGLWVMVTLQPEADWQQVGQMRPAP